MKLGVKILKEPELEFGHGVRGVSPKNDMPLAGPFWTGQQDKELAEIPLGLIAPKSEIDPILKWFERMEDFLPSDERNSLRYPTFPGIRRAMRARFTFDKRHILPLGRDFELALAHAHEKPRFDALLDVYTKYVQSLGSDQGPKAIIVQFPEEVATLSITNPALTPAERRRLERMSSQEQEEQLSLFEPEDEAVKGSEEIPRADELLTRYFHRAFKAQCMKLPNAVPTQVVRLQTYDPAYEVQSEATRAWNLSVALLYKAGAIPWRPASLDNETCFVGVSFHHLKRRGGSLLYASVAHAFSNAVEPFILRGSPIPHHQTKNKQPYLLPAEAEAIGRRVVDGYRIRTGANPLRLVIHKTSHFAPEEVEGFASATKNEVPNTSLVWMRSTGFRLLRRGLQEPLRGTFCNVGDDRTFLFTTGYVKWWEEYPGPHIPAPLEIGADDPLARSFEILSLSKMNWNSADGLGRMPITLGFARRVGMIMTELDEDDPEPNPSYRFYM
jgi:hypothetical protein